MQVLLHCFKAISLSLEHVVLLKNLIFFKISVDMHILNAKQFEDRDCGLAFAELVLISVIVQSVNVDLANGLHCLVLLVEPLRLLDGGAALHGDARDLAEVLGYYESEVSLVVFFA
jgi:hypothetical protein